MTLQGKISFSCVGYIHVSPLPCEGFQWSCVFWHFSFSFGTLAKISEQIAFHFAIATSIVHRQVAGDGMQNADVFHAMTFQIHNSHKTCKCCNFSQHLQSKLMEEMYSHKLFPVASSQHFDRFGHYYMSGPLAYYSRSAKEPKFQF